ncbi:unnamed protein product, partial [Brugia pahangi]|uniref:Ovule protein n=1 Tax=Brugia pahangi TaxID=6280 RepID=A0A0N4TXL4_BRUPA
ARLSCFFHILHSVSQLLFSTNTTLCSIPSLKQDLETVEFKLPSVGRLYCIHLIN